MMLKLKKPSMSGNLLNIIEDFLANQSERVVINRQDFKWVVVNINNL